MTIDERLKFCRICKNQKSSMTFGVICRITNQIPDFEDKCNIYEEDVDLVSRLTRIKIGNNMNTASLQKRFANFILDAIFYFVFCIILGLILGIIIGLFAPSLSSLLDGENKLTNYLIGSIALIMYYVIYEGLTGRSVAKFITKTKVINEKGEKPNLRTILLRTICRFIPFDALSFFSDDNSGWHDKFSKTRVVDI